MSSIFDAIWIEMPMIPYVVMLMLFTGRPTSCWVMLARSSPQGTQLSSCIIGGKRQRAAGSRHNKDTKTSGEEGDIEAHVVACHLSASRGTSRW